jgi:hypothetical protein
MADKELPYHPARELANRVVVVSRCARVNRRLNFKLLKSNLKP